MDDSPHGRAARLRSAQHFRPGRPSAWAMPQAPLRLAYGSGSTISTRRPKPAGTTPKTRTVAVLPIPPLSSLTVMLLLYVPQAMLGRQCIVCLAGHARHTIAPVLGVGVQQVFCSVAKLVCQCGLTRPGGVVLP